MILNIPLSFYKEEKYLFENELVQINKKLFKLSMTRLFVFLSIIFCGWFFFGNMKVIIPVLIIGIAFFFYLVTIYSDLKLLNRKHKS